MTYHFVVTYLYKFSIRRIRGFILPLSLLVSYLSAVFMNKTSSSGPFTRIEISMIHIISGIVLSMICLVLIYDFTILFIKQRKKKILLQKKKIRKVPSQAYIVSFHDIINYLFVFVLFILSLLGIILFAIGQDSLFLLFLNQNWILFAHIFLGWLFLSLILLKYYLAITRLSMNLIRYLREY